MIGADVDAPARHAACLVEERDSYPYPCAAADERPDDRVIVCPAHRCWWHLDRATGKRV